jgi:hypothetical protein
VFEDEGSPLDIVPDAVGVSVLVSRDLDLCVTVYLNSHCGLPHYHTELRGRKEMKKRYGPFRSSVGHSFLSVQVWFRFDQSIPNTGLLSERIGYW